MEEKFCKFCGEKIPMDAVICSHCGRQVEELKKEKGENIIINNSSAASAASSSSVKSGHIRRKYSILFDIFMIFITGGLWIIWMIIRPKYY